MNAPSLLRVAIVIMLVPIASAGQPSPRPNFDGIWNSATITPIERPANLKDKAFYTPAEVAQIEREAEARNGEETKEQIARSKGTGTYNAFFREWGTRVVKTLRTSIVTDPPDGRIPPLTPKAEANHRQWLERIKKAENPEDLGLQDQCVGFLTAGPPMLPDTVSAPTEAPGATVDPELATKVPAKVPLPFRVWPLANVRVGLAD